ncbi:MAG: YncE family protein [Anaerolineae bacterium]|nr:MAG: YncE family protein [Anaerolineae bacterium]
MRKTIGVILLAFLTMIPLGTSWAYFINVQGQSSLKKEAVIATVNVGRYPHGVAVNEETNRVYVANFNEGSISIIDGTTNEVIDTIKVGKGPRDVTVNAQTNRLYVANIGLHDMSAINSKILPWVGLRLYWAKFAVSVIDGHTNETLVHVSVGTNPWIIEASETTNRIYVANYGSYSVSVIDGESNEVIATIGMGLFRTPVGPLDIGAGRLLIVDGDTNKVLSTLRVGCKAHVAVNERTNRVYVTSRHSGTLSVIDGRTKEVIATFDVGPDPYGLAVNEEANRIYVANHDGNSVWVIDGHSNEVLYTIGVEASPVFVAVNEATGRVYVTNSGDDTVSVLESLILE